MLVYVYVSGLNWGKGKSLKEARLNCQKFGSSMYNGKKSFAIVEAVNIDNIYINDVGDIYHGEADKVIATSIC